ncbi:MAG: RNA-directed DNA polymerase, partial [Proteobacteria bacterium]|nr:RNA-directed DNA polymerase [Pseudomonadota bacterium]
MTKLIKLKEAKNLSELARLLGYQPKGLSYILYKIDENNKYRTFKICKKHGGKRTINAPHPKLSLLQKRLAQMLYECLEEHKKERKKDDPPFWPASHGFQKKRTIVSNAEAHKRKRFVFNLDLEDFFGTINFG